MSTELIATIVIPIRLKSIRDDGFQRLTQLLSIIPNSYEIIIVDDGSPKSMIAHLQSLIMPHVKILRLNTRWKLFSLARARNTGLKAATAPVVIFHDVDFITHPSIYQKIEQHIQQIELATHPEKWFCLPVAFLTEQGNHHFVTHLKNNNLSIWHELIYNSLTPIYAKFIVEGSSAIVVNREQCLAMGGFDETYIGHGAEDFELLHRLSCLYPIAEQPVDYVVNTGSGEIKEYRGFRAYFALYGKEARGLGLNLVHLYHPKRKNWFYYRHRKNFKKLHQLMMT